MVRKAIIFDTTYILPLFGFEINFSDDIVTKIKQLWINGLNDYELIIPSIALIEVMDKFNVLFRNGQDASVFDYLNNTLPTILKLPYIQIFHCESSTIVSEMVSKIRILGHNDLMDCYIAATAFAVDGIYLTEEITIQNILKKIPEYHVNRIMDWKKFHKSILNS